MRFRKSPKSLVGAARTGPALLILRTDVTEDDLAKWAFAESAKLY